MNENTETSCETTVAALVDELFKSFKSLGAEERYILGIVGYPGAGKSTVAEWLVEGLNDRISERPAKIVPMDGFHLSNEILTQRQLLDLKGIPDTFDGVGFVDLLNRLRRDTEKTVYCPLFDRTIEASIEDAIKIEPQHRICVVEGNYLLLDRKPWSDCRKFFNQVWFLDVTFDTILPRLLERHIAGGRTSEGARIKVESTDLPNARLVEQTKTRADRLIRIKG